MHIATQVYEPGLYVAGSHTLSDSYVSRGILGHASSQPSRERDRRRPKEPLGFIFLSIGDWS